MISRGAQGDAVLTAIDELAQMALENEQHAERAERLEKVLGPTAGSMKQKARRRSRDLQEQIVSLMEGKLEEAFKQFDTDKNGTIDGVELMHVMAEMAQVNKEKGMLGKLLGSCLAYATGLLMWVVITVRTAACAEDEELANDYSWYPEWSVAEICEASLPQFAVSALWLLISLLLTSTYTFFVAKAKAAVDKGDIGPSGGGAAAGGAAPAAPPVAIATPVAVPLADAVAAPAGAAFATATSVATDAAPVATVCATASGCLATAQLQATCATVAAVQGRRLPIGERELRGSAGDFQISSSFGGPDGAPHGGSPPAGQLTSSSLEPLPGLPYSRSFVTDGE